MKTRPEFSKAEADRILKRAAEIEGTEETKSLSLADLRSIAGEAGFGLHAVDRAIAEARRAVSLDRQPPPVKKWGFIISHMATTRSVPVEVSSEQLMRAVRIFHPYREGLAQVKLEEHQITWRDRKGLEFTMGSSAGTTEIRVYISKILIRRGKWMRWVKAAADRLETIVFLVGTQASSASRQALPLPSSGDESKQGV